MSNSIGRLVSVLNEIGMTDLSRGKNEDALVAFSEAIEQVHHQGRLCPGNLSGVPLTGNFKAPTLGQSREDTRPCLISESCSGFDQGMHVYSEALHLSVIVLSFDGLLEATLEYNIGQACIQKKNYDWAKQSFLKALSVVKEFPKTGCSNTGMCHSTLSVSKILHNIGYCCYSLGQLDEAILYYQIALTEASQSTGQSSLRRRELAVNANCIALLHIRRNGEEDSSKALKFLRQASSFVDLEQYDRDLAIFCWKVATMYYVENEYKQAIQFLLEALGIHQRLSDTHEVIDTLKSLGKVYSASADYNSALLSLHQAYNLELDVYGPEDERLVGTVSDMGLLSFVLGHFNSALNFYMEALRIRLGLLGFKSDATLRQEVGDALNAVGTVFLMMKQYLPAKRAFMECFYLRQRNLSPTHHHDVAAVLHNLGICEIDSGNVEQGLRFYNQSLQMKIIAVGEYHPDICTVLLSLGQVYQQLGYLEGSLNYYQRGLQIARLLTIQYGDCSAVVQLTCQLLSAIGNVELMRGNVPEMMAHMVEAARLASRLFQTDQVHLSIEVRGHFFYEMSLLNPPCAPPA